MPVAPSIPMGTLLGIFFIYNSSSFGKSVTVRLIVGPMTRTAGLIAKLCHFIQEFMTFIPF
jgi:hypothetical protein